MIAALLLGLAVGPAVPADVRHQTVSLGWDTGTRACSAKVDGAEVGDPASEAGGAALARALSDRQQTVQLQGVNGIPYACVDAVVAVLRKAGHAIKVGFISEPVARP